MLATRYGAISPARSDVTLERIPTVPGGQAAPVVLPPEVHLDGFLLRLRRGYLRRVIAISASFRNVPKSHDGESGFTVGLQFSRAPEGLTQATVENASLEVTGGTVTEARQTVEGATSAWGVTVAPDGPGDVIIRLPARACTEANVVCIEGEPLEEAAQAMVPGTPLTAQFTQVPETHDGSNALEFYMDSSHEPVGFSYGNSSGGASDGAGCETVRETRPETRHGDGWCLDCRGGHGGSAGANGGVVALVFQIGSGTSGKFRSVARLALLLRPAGGDTGDAAGANAAFRQQHASRSPKSYRSPRRSRRHGAAPRPRLRDVGRILVEPSIAL